MPARLGDWAEHRRHPSRQRAVAGIMRHPPRFAAAMGVDAPRQRDSATIFSTACGGTNGPADLPQVDYAGDWHAAEKAVTGVEVRDPTADLDVVSYCFGVPPEQYLAEGIDRSLIRRAMWGLLA